MAVAERSIMELSIRSLQKIVAHQFIAIYLLKMKIAEKGNKF
jgi:hypothetical protein